MTLHWPPVPPAGNEARRELLENLEMGREGDLFPIFGEVFQLLVGPDTYV